MAVGNDAEKVLANVDLVELVGEYVRLVKAGKTFKGVCPFHPDTKPSLTVSPDKQLWYCFGCHEGGSAFQFLMKAEGLSFGEALRELAQRAGVTLERGADAGGEQREQILRLNEQAAEFYRNCLRSKEGERFRHYLQGRGISAESQQRFELGCTPASSSGLFEHLVRSGENAETLLRSGLCLRSEVDGGFSDRFRSRLMFPIRDIGGRLAGFGGRTIDDREPKYLNSPETVVFSKGNLLYGLHLAKAAISKTGKAILVEGYTDVISCFQAGVENVVATLGTALGEKHVNILKRYAPTVMAAYDSDSSGLQAMVRSAELFEAANVVLRVAMFSGGEDPDEFVRGKGREAFLAAIEGAVPATEFRLEMALANYDAQSPEARMAATSQVAKILSGLKSSQEAGHYISECAARMCLGDETRRAMLQESLLREVKQLRSGSRRGQPEEQAAMRTATEGLDRGVVEAERSVLWAILDRPELARELSARLTPGDFNDPEHVRIAQRLFADQTRQGSVVGEWVGENDGGLATLLARIALVGEGMHAVSDREVIDGYVKTITDFGKERRWKEIQQEAVRCLKEGREPEDGGLFDEYRELTRYLAGGAARQGERLK